MIIVTPDWEYDNPELSIMTCYGMFYCKTKGWINVFGVVAPNDVVVQYLTWGGGSLHPLEDGLEWQAYTRTTEANAFFNGLGTNTAVINTSHYARFYKAGWKLNWRAYKFNTEL